MTAEPGPADEIRQGLIVKLAAGRPVHLAPGEVRHVREARASYILTHRGRAVGVILPLDTTDQSTTADDTDARAAWDAFVRAGRRLARRFRPGASGVQLLSEMRR